MRKMIKKLRHFFIPHPKNNYKAKILHPSFLTLIISVFLFSQASLNLLAGIRPDVLGYSSEITPEKIIALTNRERETLGLSSLKMDPLLNKVAQAKGADMIALDYWAHNSPRGVTPWVFITDAGYNYLYAGENLARDFAAPEAVVAAWMASPTHRDNMVNPHYEDTGVAVIDGFFQGHETTLVVQMFGKNIASLAKSEEISPLGETIQSKEEIPEPTRFEAPLPEIATPAAILSQNPINPFQFTRIISLGLAAFLFLVLFIDGLIVIRAKKTRAAGHNFVHGTFLLLIIIMIILSRQGIIL